MAETLWLSILCAICDALSPRARGCLYVLLPGAVASNAPELSANKVVMRSQQRIPAQPGRALAAAGSWDLALVTGINCILLEIAWWNCSLLTAFCLANNIHINTRNTSTIHHPPRSISRRLRIPTLPTKLHCTALCSCVYGRPTVFVTLAHRGLEAAETGQAVVQSRKCL